jgi:hypothetical protein
MKGEAYYPLPKMQPGMTPLQGILCHDQQKWNLFGLVEPRIDIEGIGAVLDSSLAESIHKQMIWDIRIALSGRPKLFLPVWEQLGGAMDQNWYPNYYHVMRERALAAECRLLDRREDGNVITVNFRRAA